MDEEIDTTHTVSECKVNPPDEEVPPPEPEYRYTVNLFNARYAEEFYAKYPDVSRDVKFTKLKDDERFKNDPIIVNTVSEYKIVNAKYKALYEEWARANPVRAVTDAIHRKGESAKRNKRKEMSLLKLKKDEEESESAHKKIRVPHADDPEFARVARTAMASLMAQQTVNAKLCEAIMDRLTWLEERRAEVCAAAQTIVNGD